MRSGTWYAFSWNHPSLLFGRGNRTSRAVINPLTSRGSPSPPGDRGNIRPHDPKPSGGAYAAFPMDTSPVFGNRRFAAPLHRIPDPDFAGGGQTPSHGAIARPGRARRAGLLHVCGMRPRPMSISPKASSPPNQAPIQDAPGQTRYQPRDTHQTGSSHPESQRESSRQSILFCRASSACTPPQTRLRRLPGYGEA